MRRVVARSVYVVLLALVASALGTVTAMMRTPPGRDLLARLLSEESNRLVRGSITIGRIRGDFVSTLTLDSVVIRDTTGALLADVGQLDLRFRLANLLSKRFLFDAVRAAGHRPRHPASARPVGDRGRTADDPDPVESRWPIDD